jgi:hypothetical protein
LKVLKSKSAQPSVLNLDTTQNTLTGWARQETPNTALLRDEDAGLKSRLGRAVSVKYLKGVEKKANAQRKRNMTMQLR